MTSSYKPVNIKDFTKRLSENGVAIFLLHGVVEASKHPVRNYTRKHIEARDFELLLEALKQAGIPLSIDDVVHHKKSGKPYPKKSFVITFDDGFENNYSVAAPLLKKYQIPAIFYVSSDFIDNNTMSWIDQIEYAVELLPKGEIFLHWCEERMKFSDDASKIQVLERLRKEVKGNLQLNPEDVVRDIFQQLSIKRITQNRGALDSKMSWPQVKDLSNNSLFTVGGHSHHHLNLASLKSDDLKYEVETSLTLIEQNVGPCVHYAYPEGLAHCYSEQVISILKDHNIICCPTAIDGVNSLDQDLFHLKRIFVN